MNKQQLANKIWASANKMRSKIEANEYKDYILGFIFYKFLSEQEVRLAKENDFADEDLPQLKEEDKEIVEWVQSKLGYFIDYDNLYSTWISKDCDFEIANVRDALSAFTRLISPSHKRVFTGIFETLQTGLKKLGTSDKEQTSAVADLLTLIKDIPMNGRQDYDVLGFIYEYLISQFAANAGKKAGEFYTPHEVSLLMSEIVANHLKDRKQIEIYDPTSGSGSLLINIGKSVAKHIQKDNCIKYYAQELKQNTFNLTRMNLVMRGIIPDNIIARNGDTLKQDWPYFDDNDPSNTYQPLYVDAVVSNPPYSQNWTPPRKPKGGEGGSPDPRFDDYGIAPRGKADYAFLLHDLYHLKSDGIMTIVLPHGVLFRGEAGDRTDGGDGSEGSIRRQLVERDNIEAIIGLPSDIFFGTGIPTIIMVLRKKRSDSNVLIIDASKCCVKEGKKNKLRASDIKRIVDTYLEKKSVPKFSRLVSKEEIRTNGYNLNIPRYVNSSDDLETWDLYSTMFGGVPKSELAAFDDYWAAFGGLRETLFETNETPQTTFRVGDIRKAVYDHPSVVKFNKEFGVAFGGFKDMLRQRLLNNMLALNIGSEEDYITNYIFRQLEHIPLIDRYDAYQLFADKWLTISQDLEIIQSEGFNATRVVDPNMVIKKSGETETEVQDGWIGHVLPFALVQTTFLHDEWLSLRNKEQRLDAISVEMEETMNEMADDERDGITNDDNQLDKKKLEEKLAEVLSEVETTETDTLDQYLTLSKKADKLAFIELHDEICWDNAKPNKDGTYGKSAVNSLIDSYRRSYQFEEGSYEASIVKISLLTGEAKTLKTEVKKNADALHEHTKTFIEEKLSDEDILSLLSAKWIDTLCDHIATLPQNVVDEFTVKLIALHKKYATTLVALENDIQEASTTLAGMIDELTGNNYDMAALQEFKKVLINA